MFDFSLLPALKELAPKCLFSVDNTWLTCKLFNPLQYGADLIIESMTKYISASQCVGGMIAGDQSIMNTNIYYNIIINGLFINPDQCRLYLTGLKSLKHRIMTVGELSLDVAKWLESKTDVNRAMYPFLESHPTYKINKLLITKNYGPGVVLFHISKKFEKRRYMNEFFAKSGMIAETSYGSAYTKLDTWSFQGKSNKYDNNTSESEGIDGTWIRMALGYNTCKHDICKSLETIISS